MDVDLLIAHQIARLFYTGHSTIWDLVGTRAPGRAHDVLIRGVDGALIAYARPAAYGAAQARMNACPSDDIEDHARSTASAPRSDEHGR